MTCYFRTLQAILGKTVTLLYHFLCHSESLADNMLLYKTNSFRRIMSMFRRDVLLLNPENDLKSIKRDTDECESLCILLILRRIPMYHFCDATFI